MELEKAIKAMDRRYDCADRYGKSLWKTIRKALEELPKTPTNTTHEEIKPCSNKDCNYHAHKDYVNNCMLYHDDQMSACKLGYRA